MTDKPWSEIVRLSELRGGLRRRLTADEPTRGRIARALDLLALEDLTALVEAAPWRDGVRVSASWSARVVQLCGVTLEAFETPLAGEFTVRAAPPGSAALPSPLRLVEVDLDSEDPPDVLEGESVDLAAYVVEHLALEIDPYPRKPGATFEAPPEEREESPFAVLRRLKPPGA